MDISTFLVNKTFRAVTYSLLASGLGFAISSSYASEAPSQFIFATTPYAKSDFEVDQNNVPAETLSYRAEMLLQAGLACDINVIFKTMPWKRVLHLVEYGHADAAFRSSYKKERAVYGAYPMKDGEPDPTRAISGYSYSLFTRIDSDLKWDGNEISGSSKTVVVERGSAGIDIAKKLGLEILEVNELDQMMEMLAAKRVDGAISVTTNISALTMNPALENQIVIQQPPVKSSQGYLMFSKITYEKYPQQAECIWDEIKRIKTTPEFINIAESSNE